MLRVETSPPRRSGQIKFASAYPTRRSIHAIFPRDLLGIMGSPAFGTPLTIASGGRVPGFEGAGVVSEVGSKVNPALRLKEGLRVAFFPASCAWSDEAVVPTSSVVPLPD